MRIRKLAILLTLASTFAANPAIAQESDDPQVTDRAQTDRQRPDREHKRPRRENMTDEQRAAARERWDNMSEDERKARRDKMRARRDGKRPPKTETDAV